MKTSNRKGICNLQIYRGIIIIADLLIVVAVSLHSRFSVLTKFSSSLCCVIQMDDYLTVSFFFLQKLLFYNYRYSIIINNN